MTRFILFVVFVCFHTASGTIAPLYNIDFKSSIRDEYIVVFKNDSENVLEDFEKLRDQVEKTPNCFVRHVYTSKDFVGFSGRIADKNLLLSIRSNGGVKYVDANNYFNLTQGDACLRYSVRPDDGKLNSWGLGRLASREKQKSIFEYESSAGEGVYAYIFDSGIKTSHPRFGGRALSGTVIGNGVKGDILGHGTHVAGIVAAKEYGVAQKAIVVSVKVEQNGQIPEDNIIKALAWVQHDHNVRGSGNKTVKSVINLSLGGSLVAGESPSTIDKIESIIRGPNGNDGIPVVVAAGNEFEDACFYTPASASSAITVGATDRWDRLFFVHSPRLRFIPYFQGPKLVPQSKLGFATEGSNHGRCVDILAPGVDISSTVIGVEEVGKKSGTSMAAPFVTGVIARFLGLQDKPPSPADIKSWLIAMSTKDVVQVGTTATPNRLLYMPCLTRASPELSLRVSGTTKQTVEFTVVLFAIMANLF